MELSHGTARPSNKPVIFMSHTNIPTIIFFAARAAVVSNACAFAATAAANTRNTRQASPIRK